MRDREISPGGSNLVRTWYDFRDGRIKVPNSCELGPPAVPLPDVDNDGSAEILVVNVSMAPTLQVIADAEDRWIPARRIWNQHAYHVTNTIGVV